MKIFYEIEEIETTWPKVYLFSTLHNEQIKIEDPSFGWVRYYKIKLEDLGPTIKPEVEDRQKREIIRIYQFMDKMPKTHVFGKISNFN